MASTTRLSNHDTIRTIAPVGTTIHGGSTGNRYQTKANIGTEIFLKSGRRTDHGRHKQPGNHSNCEGQGNHQNDHRRRIRSKRHQSTNMRQPGHPGMGVVPLLVTHGRYKFGPADRAYPRPGGHNRGTRIPHIGHGTAT